MVQFSVSGMTCNGCVEAVTRAIRQRRPNAQVSVDLPQGVVTVADNADAEIISEAIEDAGFTVVGHLS